MSDDEDQFMAILAETRPATVDDVLIELRRIADALERGQRCSERKGEATCVLSYHHVGHHATGDGRLRWLDED